MKGVAFPAHNSVWSAPINLTVLHAPSAFIGSIQLALNVETVALAVKMGSRDALSVSMEHTLIPSLGSV